MTMPKFSDLTGRLAGPRSRAWDVTDRAARMEEDGQEILHLGVGDPDLDTPREIVNAAVASFDSGRTHYSPVSGETALKEAVSMSYARDFKVAVAAEHVTVFPGAQNALFATLLCLAGPDDEVILLEPFYATYEGVATAGGATVVPVACSAENDFQPDLDIIRQSISEKTRAIMINSPGNPSGAVFSETSWAALLDMSAEHGIWLISDEVYAGLVFDGQHYSPLQNSSANHNVVVISSLSKSHAMTGWRLGWAIAPKALTDHLANLVQCMQFGVSQFTQDAAVFALRNATRQAAEMRAIFRLRRNALCSALEKIDGLTVHRPAGGMFVMAGVADLGVNGEQFANQLLDDCGVAVVPGFAFGDSMHDYVRIGYLLDEAKLRIAADKIANFVSSVRA